MFFKMLISLLRDHFHNLGLSDKAFRYWTYDDSSALRREVKPEFSRDGVSDGLSKAQQWLRAASSTSRAFKLRFTDKIARGPGSELPLFRSLMWRYYFRDLDPPPKPLISESGLPVFYDPPKREDGTRMVHRPWV